MKLPYLVSDYPKLYCPRSRKRVDNKWITFFRADYLTYANNGNAPEDVVMESIGEE